MTPIDARKRSAELLQKFVAQLRNPHRLRAFVTGVVLLSGYCLIYIPLNDRITEVKAKLVRGEKSLAIAQSVGHLRKQYHTFEKRLPKTDAKEWTAYLLNGLRQFPLRMNGVATQPPCNLGPYKVVIFRFDIQGTFSDICKFLSWLEGNERLIRVDSVIISSAKTSKSVKTSQSTQNSNAELEAQITILGLTG